MLSAETVSFVKPRTTVIVQGGGGFVQRVPWNLPGFAGAHGLAGSASVRVMPRCVCRR